MRSVQRPLSPHLQVYKLPLTALMSISHRITGAGLAVGTVLVAAFLVSAAMGEAEYDYVMKLATSPIGKIVMFLWSAALYFHMCNGIRHMIWDIGKNFDKDMAMRSNFYVLIFAVLLTLLTWLLATGSFGG